MKKLAILIAVLIIMPISALARMDSMSDDSLGVIHGKVGIVIDFETSLTGSYLAITDSDGDDHLTTPSYDSTGAFTLHGLSITEDGSGNMSVVGLTLDVGTNGKSVLAIGLPAIQGHVQVDEVRIGSSADTGNSLGAITWGNINYAPTKCTVYPH